MNRIADDISENDAKVVLCCNFTSSIAVSLKTFFSSHGYVSMFRSSLNEVITLGRSIPASLICIYVSGYDTSWIRLITIMNVDPLFFVSPLLLISQNVRSLLFFFSRTTTSFLLSSKSSFTFIYSRTLSHFTNCLVYYTHLKLRFRFNHSIINY